MKKGILITLFVFIFVNSLIFFIDYLPKLLNLNMKNPFIGTNYTLLCCSYFILLFILLDKKVINARK